MASSSEALGRFRYSRIENLEIHSRDMSWGQPKTELLASLIRANPGLKKFKWTVRTIDKTFAFKELMNSFNYSTLEELHFNIVTWRLYQALVDAIPLTTGWSEDENGNSTQPSTLKKLLLGHQLSWDKNAFGDKMDSYIKAMAGKAPDCLVEFSGPY